MRPGKSLWLMVLAILMVLATAIWAPAFIEGGGVQHTFTKDFMIEQCTFLNVGTNPFFVLEPGAQLILEGEEDKEDVRVAITVTGDTEEVYGIQSRVVEEREWKQGGLVEVSRNFFAICEETNSVFYFGEDVDIYEGGIIVSHDGTWRAGEEGAEPGIIMPGTVLLGARYFQEMAPDVAMDRAEITGMNKVLETPAGTFAGCLETKETTPIEPNAKDFKFYAPGIGLVKSGPLALTYYFIP